MKIDGNELSPSNVIKTDICIIGAGAAGIAIAKEFIGTSKNVYLLEAGSYEYSDTAQDFYISEKVEFNPATIFDKDYTRWSRLRYFGGSTNHWGGWSRPFESFDFDQRSWVPDSGWPFSRQDISEHYDRACDLIQIPRYDFKNETDSSLAKKSDDFDKLFATAEQNPEIQNRFFSYSPPTKFGEAYGEELHQSSNINVVTNANVTRIDCFENGQRVSKIEFMNGNLQKFELQAQIFILACGGLENPRLLLNSDHQTPGGLGNQNDLVGRYFMEHPHSTFAWLFNNQGEDWVSSFNAKGFNEVRRAFMTSPEFQKQHGLMNYSCELTIKPTNLSSSQEISEILKVSQDVSKNSLYLRLYTRSEMAPRHQNRVALGNERDPLGLRRMIVQLEYGKEDLATVRKSTEAVVRHLSFLNLGRAQFVTKDKTSWTPDTSGGCHHMGTTRISDNPKEGVVDRHCRVHGIENLVMAGSSVFPTGGFANPTLTLVALALRTADDIKKGIIK